MKTKEIYNVCNEANKRFPESKAIYDVPIRSVASLERNAFIDGFMFAVKQFNEQGMFLNQNSDIKL